MKRVIEINHLFCLIHAIVQIIRISTKEIFWAHRLFFDNSVTVTSANHRGMLRSCCSSESNEELEYSSQYSTYNTNLVSVSKLRRMLIRVILF